MDIRRGKLFYWVTEFLVKFPANLDTLSFQNESKNMKYKYYMLNVRQIAVTLSTFLIHSDWQLQNLWKCDISENEYFIEFLVHSVYCISVKNPHCFLPEYYKPTFSLTTILHSKSYAINFELKYFDFKQIHKIFAAVNIFSFDLLRVKRK